MEGERTTSNGEEVDRMVGVKPRKDFKHHHADDDEILNSPDIIRNYSFMHEGFGVYCRDARGFPSE